MEQKMTSTHQPGTIERGQEHTTLRFTRQLTRPSPKAWEMLTESEHLRWWMPADMVGDKESGASVQMVFWPDLVERNGLAPDAGTATIEIWEPTNTFAWVWHGSRIRFDIVATSRGSDVSLTVDIDTADPEAIVDNACGYQLWMDHLATLVNTGSSAPIADGDPEPLKSHYRSVVAST